MIGKNIHGLMETLWPICRSISGNGVRETLKILQHHLPDLKILEIPTGTECFDWEVPKEWNIEDAYVLDPSGNKIIDFKKSNLHLVNYSIPVDLELDLEDLQNHLHSLENQPDAIPYVTSYYKEYWGFCISHNQRKKLPKGKYRVKVNSTLSSGSLTYGELIIKGKTSKEIFISTYVCHPSMANNELSGPCLTTFLAKYIQSINPNYTYRIIFIPETIGAICYLSKHLETLQSNVIGGYNINCVGDDKNWSFLPSKEGNLYIDRLTRRVLKKEGIQYKEYSFLTRGSDERQYCSPGIDLPICSVMRSKYDTFAEYHTSLDNLEFVSSRGLHASYELYCKLVNSLEKDILPNSLIKCEPMMSKRGLRPTIGKRGSAYSSRILMNFLTYSNGKNSIEEIAHLIGCNLDEAKEVFEILKSHELVELPI